MPKTAWVTLVNNQALEALPGNELQSTNSLQDQDLHRCTTTPAGENNNF